MREYAPLERPERDNASVRRRPSQKSAPAPSYEESEADSPLIRRAQRHKAEVTLRQFAAERVARQAEQGEPVSASVSLPPTSTLARRLQERSGDAVAAALMRQFAAERTAREAETDALPPPIPLRRRTAAVDGSAGQIQRADTPAIGPQRTEEDSVTGSAPLARLSAEVPAIPARMATVPNVVEQQGSTVARAVTTESAHRAATGAEPASTPSASAAASVSPAVSASASVAPLVERTAVPDVEPASEVAALHRRVEASPASADGGTAGPGARGLQRQTPAAPPVVGPSGLAPLVIPSTSRQLDILRARGDGVPLDPQTLRRMEANMRVPLGDMRIHNDPDAWTLCQRLGAQAYADGTDIYFQKGAYQPGTPQGRNLLGRQLQRAVAWRTEQQAKEAAAAQAAQSLVARATEHPEAAAPVGPDAESTRQHGETGGVVQAQAEVGLAGGPLSAELSGRIQSKRGAGASLDPATRAGMETAFGASFSGVRIHTDGEADALNRGVSAVAFTVGQDIFFRSGAYQPGTPHGQHLLAHELTHVVQQRSGAAGGGSGPLMVGPAGDGHEQEADTTAAVVAAHLNAPPPASTSSHEDPASAAPAAPAQHHAPAMAGPSGAVRRNATPPAVVRAFRYFTGWTPGSAPRSAPGVARLVQRAVEALEAPADAVAPTLPGHLIPTRHRRHDHASVDHDAGRHATAHIVPVEDVGGHAPHPDHTVPVDNVEVHAPHVDGAVPHSASLGTQMHTAPHNPTVDVLVETHQDRHRPATPAHGAASTDDALSAHSAASAHDQTQSHETAAHSDTPVHEHDSPVHDALTPAHHDEAVTHQTTARHEGPDHDAPASNPNAEYSGPAGHAASAGARASADGAEGARLVIAQVLAAARAAQRQFDAHVSQGSAAIALRVQAQQRTLAAAAATESAAIRNAVASARGEVIRIVAAARATVHATVAKEQAALEHWHGEATAKARSDFQSHQQQARALGDNYATQALNVSNTAAGQAQSQIEGFAGQARAMGHAGAAAGGSEPQIAQAKAKAATDLANDTASKITSGLDQLLAGLRGGGPPAAARYRQKGQEAARAIGTGLPQALSALDALRRNAAHAIQQGAQQGERGLAQLQSGLTTGLSGLESAAQGQVRATLAQQTRGLALAGQQAATGVRAAGQRASAAGASSVSQVTGRVARMRIDPKKASAAAAELSGQIRQTYAGTTAQVAATVAQAQGSVAAAGAAGVSALKGLAPHVVSQTQAMVGQAQGQASGLARGVSSGLTATVTQTTTAGQQLVTRITTSLTKALTDLKNGMERGLTEFRSSLDKKVQEKVAKAREPLNTLPGRIAQAQARVEQQMRAHIQKKPDNIFEAAWDAVKSAASWVADQLAKAWNWITSHWAEVLLGLLIAIVVIAAIIIAPELVVALLAAALDTLVDAGIAALGAGALGALWGAGSQMVSNLMHGKGLFDGVLQSAWDGAVSWGSFAFTMEARLPLLLAGVGLGSLFKIAQNLDAGRPWNQGLGTYLKDQLLNIVIAKFTKFLLPVVGKIGGRLLGKIPVLGPLLKVAGERLGGFAQKVSGRLGGLLASVGERSGVRALLTGVRERLGTLVTEFVDRIGLSKLAADGQARWQGILADLGERSGASKLLARGQALLDSVTTSLSGATSRALARAGDWFTQTGQRIGGPAGKLFSDVGDSLTRAGNGLAPKVKLPDGATTDMSGTTVPHDQPTGTSTAHVDDGTTTTNPTHGDGGTADPVHGDGTPDPVHGDGTTDAPTHGDNATVTTDPSAGTPTGGPEPEPAGTQTTTPQDQPTTNPTAVDNGTADPAHSDGRDTPTAHNGPEPGHEPDQPSKTPQDTNIPKSWEKFDRSYDTAFKEELRGFRGNDNLDSSPSLRGGEGQLFLSDNEPNLALKRWFSRRVADMPASIKLLEDAGSAIEANPSLKADIDVVKIYNTGSDWVVRDFDPNSGALGDFMGDSAASAARDRAIAEIEAMQNPDSILQDILKKLKRNSANIHWSPGKQKILIIDMQ